MNREQRILERLKTLEPIHIELKNDSQKHAGHVEHLGGAGFTGETHYKLLIVSEKFTSLNRIDRQRTVNDLLKEEFQTGLHALEMKTLSPFEYKAT